MMTFIIGLGVVLVLLILYMIFRVGTLSALLGKKKQDDTLRGNSVNGFLFLLFAIVGTLWFFYYSYTYFDSYSLPVATEHGVDTDRLFWITMAITLAAFVPICFMLFLFAFKYRYSEKRRAFFFPHSNALEITWTVIPFVVLTFLVARGLNVWNEITGLPSKDAEVIELVGQQFAWTARYPGVKDNQLGTVNYKLIDAVNEFGLDLTDTHSYDDFKSLELHLPKGKQVLLKIRSKDVLHSVFIPYFRVKMDAVPGMITTFKFIATKSTEEMRSELNNPDFNYELACAELCGRGHFSMRFLVVVDEPEEYEKWKKEQEPWLKQNPEYLVKVPANLSDVAIRKSSLPSDYGEKSNMVRSIQAR